MAKEFDAYAEVSVAGRGGPVASVIVRRLAAVGFSDALTSLRPRPDAARVRALAGT